MDDRARGTMPIPMVAVGRIPGALASEGSEPRNTPSFKTMIGLPGCWSLRALSAICAASNWEGIDLMKTSSKSEAS